MEIIESLWLALGLCTLLFFIERRENNALKEALDSAVEKMVMSEMVIMALMEELNKNEAEM